jgi:hypothetical protein
MTEDKVLILGMKQESAASIVLTDKQTSAVIIPATETGMMTNPRE